MNLVKGSHVIIADSEALQGSLDFVTQGERYEVVEVGARFFKIATNDPFKTLILGVKDLPHLQVVLTGLGEAT